MAILKYKKADGTWGKVGAPLATITPESIGAIANPAGAEEGQVLMFDGANWIADDAGSGAVVGDTAPENPEEGDLWLDTSEEGNTEESEYISKPETVTEGQILTYSNGEWVAADAPEGGVTSVNGQTGDVTIEIPEVDYPVTSVNGQTGDVTIEMPEVNYPVTSVNGMTGAVNLSIPSQASDVSAAPIIQYGTTEVADGDASFYPEGTLYVVISE